MDFFRRQEQARSLTRVLVTLFALSAVAVTVAVDFVLLTVVATAGATPARLVLPTGAWIALHPGLLVFWTACVLAVIGGASLYKTALLSGGGAVVALGVGAERVAADTTDPDRKRLLDVVEEMAIAAGLPMPQVYVLNGETGINAFAAGHAPADAAITVTAGCLRLLDRAELQGVIAHEFSHVVNGDMRLGVRLMGLLFGLMVVAGIARWALRLVPRGRRGGGAVAVFMLAAALVYCLGYIGLFFGRLIQAAVSRRREALADAAAVQFTRDTTGLRGALVKIGAGAGSRLIDADADEVAHLLFAPGMPRLFATHPPLLERIRELDPQFDPREFARIQPELAARRLGTAPPAAAGAAPQGAARRSLPLGRFAVNPAAVSALVGNPGTAHIELAQSIRASLPPDLVSAAARSDDALGLLLALTMEREPPLRAQELNYVERQLGAATRAAVEHWLPTAEALNVLQCQPALLRLLPALRQLPAAERQQLLLCLNGLSELDGRRSLSQYALRRLAQVHLRDAMAPPARPGLGAPPTSQALHAEVAVLLAVLAQQGNADATRAAHAYASGLASILPEADPRYAPPANWPAQLDVALNRLDRLAPSSKQQLIEAMVRTIGDDGELSPHEAELLRAVCASLHCPLPPLLTASAATT
jgi:Zn-dependent protease with chaperone function